MRSIIDMKVLLGGAFDVYAQFLIDDPGATGGAAFSNAIKAVFQP